MNLMNMLGDLTDNTLQLWVDDPTKDNSIFKALMTLFDPHPARLAADLAKEARSRNIESTT